MKKTIFFMLSLISTGIIAAYPNVQIENLTAYNVVVTVDYTGCRKDNNVTIAPGESSNIYRGACLLSEITGEVLEEQEGGRHTAGRRDIERKTIRPYSSSGTSYSHYIISGPDRNGEYKCTRDTEA